MAKLKDLKIGDRVALNGYATKSQVVRGVIEDIFFNWQNHTWYAAFRDDRTGRLRRKPISHLDKE